MAKTKEPKSMTLNDVKVEIERLLLNGVDPETEVLVIGNGHADRVFATTYVNGKLYVHHANNRNCDRFANGNDAANVFAEETGETLEGLYGTFLNFRKFLKWLYKKPVARKEKKEDK